MLRVQLGIVRARILLRMGRSRDALRIIEAIHDDAAIPNPVCSIAFCIVLAFAALDHDGIEIPKSRLGEHPEPASIHECGLATEALVNSKLIATFDGLDPGLFDRTDWAWIESVVGPAKPNNLRDIADVTGFARRVLAGLA